MDHPYLTQEHDMFRRALRKFLEQEAVPNFDKWEEDRLIPRDFWKKLGSQGYLCPTVPEQYGGAGVDFSFSVVVNEELERVGSSLVGIGLHSDIVVPYLLSYGTEAQKNKWLPGCLSGDVITAVAMTEPAAGSDLAGIKTTAVRDGDSYVLNGSKTFITNGIQADLILVACKTDVNATPPHSGISLIWVERDTPGFSRGKKLDKVGQHGQDTAELYFDDCRVPALNVLGEEGRGFAYMSDKLQQERLIVSIAAQVSAEQTLHDTIEYVQQRTAFGKPISKFQNTRFRLAEMATEVDIGRNYIEQLVSRHIAGEDVVTEVSMAKWWITEMAKRIVDGCMQLFGGYGYMEEYAIARRYRDIPVMRVYAGTNEIMKTIIAKRIGL
ncbi:acyl-CoA dehydrogenase family protein [Alicyclobacillus sp. SO9]|uniref:acyl-CoA dehydrogenase family protein n=1 Tax=Alicyclobacillus sp. SO9 TaxID=2665646 RepID=UPI0018E77B05|nr:acyl-CoA dehydrogenase family protein [Alicyclobacillus sp. SO9]QQE80778.1 acyl-CoA dehydrogenase family protein [Alicyclobacillus sp. SO9]